MRRTRLPLAVLALFWPAMILVSGRSTGMLQTQKKAKELGYPAANCLYCHTVKLPKKETFKPEELNERGKWLLAEKEKRKAKEVDAAWLKGYPGDRGEKK